MQKEVEIVNKLGLRALNPEKCEMSQNSSEWQTARFGSQLGRPRVDTLKASRLSCIAADCDACTTNDFHTDDAIVCE
jgi:hypothetical protein